MAPAPVHYLKASKTTWSPPHLYVLDTETRTEVDGPTEVEALRLWCAKVIDRTGPIIGGRSSVWTRGTTADGLARSVDHVAERRETLWLFAHNLAFDLVTTRLPLQLIDLGWVVGDFALSGDAPWMRMSKGRRSLTLVDSVSFLPMSIKALGKLLGVAKPALPRQDAAEKIWLRRCRADVEILARGLIELMDWHDREGRGFFSVSGTATAWGHMRQRLAPKSVVIDPAAPVQARDRAALYGGRRSVWRVGTFRGRRYLEVDLVAAYPTAATELAVPVRRAGTYERMPLDTPHLDDPTVGLIAQCVIATDSPRYPVRYADAVWYPTGTFATTLAGPELSAARARGELVSIGACEWHRLAPALADWASWLLELRGAGDDQVPAPVRAALKVWGRTVIGRFAGHSWTRTELGPAPSREWNYEPGMNMTTGLPGGNVDLGGRRWWVEQTEGADNAYPAVTAWVESAVRAALATVVDLIGPNAVLVANTDGLVVAETMLGSRAAGGAVRAPAGLTGAARTRWVLDQVSAAVAPLSLAVKRSATNVTVLGPTHVRLGAQRKLAGIPTDADEDAPGEFSFRAWPTMTWQMAEGDGRGYHRPMMLRKVDGPYPAGWVLDDGTVMAPHAYLGADGTTQLAGWARTPNRPAGRILAGRQHPVLDGLL